MTDLANRRHFLRNSLAAGTAVMLTGADTASGDVPARPAPADANPRVRPGRVQWQRDFAAACTEARRSNKPVLHFQMLGRMDEKFC